MLNRSLQQLLFCSNVKKVKKCAVKLLTFAQECTIFIYAVVKKRIFA